jgi:NADPH:quinone reductase-like Zn-dependent oxidoreductase
VKAIVVSELGDPEVLRLREQPAPVPGPGQILVDISAAGVNFMDTGARRPGSAATRPVPFVPGVEAAGSVRELGAGVSDFAVGDRVTWVTPTAPTPSRSRCPRRPRSRSRPVSPTRSRLRS